MKQSNNAPMDVPQEVATLWALKSGVFNDIEIGRVGEAAQKLREYLAQSVADVLEALSQKREFDGELEAALGDACAKWRKTFA